MILTDFETFGAGCGVSSASTSYFDPMLALEPRLRPGEAFVWLTLWSCVRCCSCLIVPMVPMASREELFDMNMLPRLSVSLSGSGGTAKRKVKHKLKDIRLKVKSRNHGLDLTYTQLT